MTDSQSPTLTARLREMATGWRNKAARLEAEGREQSRGTGVVHPAEWEASRLLDCATEVEALLAAGEATPQPQEIRTLRNAAVVQAEEIERLKSELERLATALAEKEAPLFTAHDEERQTKT